MTDTDNLIEELKVSGEENALETEATEYRSFNPEEIDVSTKILTVGQMLRRLEEGELILTPDFQRRANIWTPSRKSALIESLLLKIPLPSLYVSEDRQGHYTVVDGLQRVCAIAHFINVDALNKACNTNLTPLNLVDLQSFVEHTQKTYDLLPRPLQRRIDETELMLHVIRPGTPSDVKFTIFSRINQGGLPLTAQEIRNALYPGKWREKIVAMAENGAFKKVTKIKSDRMEDMELVLRFVALYNLKIQNKTRAKDQILEEFLNHTVTDHLHKWDDQKWEETDFAFNKAMKACMDIFGALAFKKKPDSPINRGLFEAESVALALRSLEDIERLKGNSVKVQELFKHYLKNDGNFLKATSSGTGTGSASNKRLETLESIFEEVLLYA